MRWLCLLFCISLFADQDPTNLAVTEGFPSFLIDGCVSAITGDYYYLCDDIVVSGAELIRIPRNYLSNRALDKRGGWSNLEHIYAELNVLFYRTTEANGTKLNYKRNPQNGKCHLTDYSKALTNCGRGEISARHDLANQYVVPNNSLDHFRVLAANGTVRVFKKTHSDSEMGIAYFHLQREELPNGHFIHYSYNANNELIEIKTTNANKTKTFAWAKFEWPARDDNSQNHKITTSDGQCFDLVYKRLKHYAHDLYEFQGHKEISILRRSNSWNKPQEQYEYYLALKKWNPKLRTIHLPEGRSHTIHYYDDPKKVTLTNGVTIKLKGTDDPRIGAVRSLLDGNHNTLYTFIYHPFKYTNNHTYTEVYDALGNKTVYASKSNYHPFFIKRYNDKKLISSEYFTFKDHRLTSVATYDEKGVLIHKREYSYDHGGNVISEKFTHKGHKAITKRSFTKNNLLKSETNPAGLTTKYTYLGSTDLIKNKTLEDEDGIFLTESYAYDSDYLLKSKTITDGITHTTTTYERLQSGAFTGMPSAITESYFDGAYKKQLQRLELEYNIHGQVTKKRIYDANNSHRYTETIDYDKKGRIVSEVDALGRTTTYGYDAFNNITYSNNPADVTLEMAYDYRNRLIEQVENSTRQTTYKYNIKSDLTATTDYRGETTTFSYDGLSRVIQTIEPLDRTTHITYDAQDNPITTTDANGHVTTIEYNARKQPIQITYPDGAIEKKTYDCAGRLISEINANHIQTSYTVDTLGRITSKTTAGNTEKWGYSAFDLLTYTDAEGNLTKYTYDGAGRKIFEELSGETIAFTYDALGRLHQTIIENSASVVEYDLLNRPIEELTEDLAGNTFTKIAYTYDTFGNKASIIRSTGTETFSYDRFNRLIIHTNALGHKTKTRYPDDFTTITIDPLNRSSVEKRDALDRIVCIQTLDPSGGEIAREDFTCDLIGNKLSQTSTIYRENEKRTSTLRWEYDQRDRIISLIEAANTPLERTTKTTYTPTGQIASIIKPSGIRLDSTYDEFDRLTTFISSDGTVHYRYTYNGLNQLVYVLDPITRTSTKRKWDPKGRLLFEGLANGFTLASIYDQAGRRRKLKLPSGTVDYTYDAHFLRSVSYNGHTHSYLDYDQDGNLLSQELINNHGIVNYTIDALGRTISLKHPTCEHTLDEFDAAGNLLKSDQNTYAYDHLNHLISENDKTYTYDSHHNRASVNALNELPDIIYDKDGNPIQSGHTHYTYDALGRLTSIKKNGITTTYTYDFLHRRLTASDGTRYLYDDKCEIGTDSELRILGLSQGAEIGAAILLEIDGYTYAPLHDLHGNLSALFYSGQKPYQTYTFDAFSHTSTSTWLAAPYSPWRYSSKRHDPSGLIYFGRRYYDPTLGRFLTPDPTGFTDGPNLYQFALGNPLIHHDLYGEMVMHNGFDDIQRISEGDYRTATIKSIGTGIHRFGTHALVGESIQTGIRGLGSWINGDRLPIGFEKPEIITIPGKQHSWGSYFGINGILTSKQNAIKMGYMHHEMSGGYEINIGYNPSHGFLSDLSRCALELLGAKTSAIKMTSNFADHQWSQHSKIILGFSHSEGAIINRSGLLNAKYYSEFKNQCVSNNFGPGFLTKTSEILHSTNYMNFGDIIPFFANTGLSLFGHRSNNVYINPQSFSLIKNHDMMGEKYTEAAKLAHWKIHNEIAPLYSDR